ncbi:MAG TPA: DUF4010 domain-containing protein [Stellaceae bacterium]|jgi:uncharacterized membrane protein (DUF4010 family)|nr:DUF4010 domain-containing protein [Stellaceae bacterium]
MSSPAGPSVIGFALLLGLSLFFGLAFEEFNIRAGWQRPGGVRTFPLLALTGALLYLLDPSRFLPLVAGLIALGGWLAIAYWQQLCNASDAERSVELVAPICAVLAYLTGPVALALPPWVAVAVTVAAVLLLTSRETLHALAQRVEMEEIVTAAKFLILTGIVLPLLPNEPVTALTAITPYKAWLALLAVCTLSYASYLLQRFLAPADSDLAVALLGGLYSSTATTVVLARGARAQPGSSGTAQAGIMLATSVMYLRILAIIAVFDWGLAQSLAPVMGALFVIGAALAVLQYRRAGRQPKTAVNDAPRNPLELTAAALFTLLFIVISIATQWARSHFGAAGVDTLAAVVGFTDIDPFVLSLAQGGTDAMPVAATAILIAIASNNVLKASYAVAFAGWRASISAASVLVALGLAGVAAIVFV